MPIFRRAKRWGLVISTLILASLLLSACGENSPSILNTAGPVADREAGLFWFILVVATIVFVIVEAILIYSIVRYREQPNSPMPKQTHGNNTVEIVWTVIPSIFLFVVLIVTIYTMFSLAQPAGPSLNVRVVAHQWWWEFDYENTTGTTANAHVITADELVVPTGTVIHLDLRSDNVIHSFWVPALTGKTDVVPGHNNDKWFQADKTGTYLGICTEFCGLEHAEMKFKVIAKSPDDYQTWLSGQQQVAQTSNDANVVAGSKLFLTAACAGCHGIVGSTNLKSFDDPAAENFIGPNLTHFGSRTTIAGDVLTWSLKSCVVTGSGATARISNKQACGLWQWLHDPNAIKPGTDMAIRQLSDTEIAQLVAYLESLT
ncbi:MAG: cytochrome c oxidase subunit II [Ktedonobacteraceae bacterium]